jgi:DNA-binding IclR family transcriptional regulator
VKKITSLRKGIMVLKRLAGEPYEMSAIELSNDLKLNRSTIHRILNNLIEEGLVEQNSNNKKYRLGEAINEIGLGYINFQNRCTE